MPPVTVLPQRRPSSNSAALMVQSIRNLGDTIQTIQNARQERKDRNYFFDVWENANIQQEDWQRQQTAWEQGQVVGQTGVPPETGPDAAGRQAGSGSGSGASQAYPEPSQRPPQYTGTNAAAIASRAMDAQMGTGLVPQSTLMPSAAPPVFDRDKFIVDQMMPYLSKQKRPSQMSQAFMQGQVSNLLKQMDPMHQLKLESERARTESYRALAEQRRRAPAEKVIEDEKEERRRALHDEIQGSKESGAVPPDRLREFERRANQDDQTIKTSGSALDGTATYDIVDQVITYDRDTQQKIVTPNAAVEGARERTAQGFDAPPSKRSMPPKAVTQPRAKANAVPKLKAEINERAEERAQIKIEKAWDTLDEEQKALITQGLEMGIPYSTLIQASDLNLGN